MSTDEASERLLHEYRRSAADEPYRRVDWDILAYAQRRRIQRRHGRFAMMLAAGLAGTAVALAFWRGSEVESARASWLQDAGMHEGMTRNVLLSVEDPGFAGLLETGGNRP